MLRRISFVLLALALLLGSSLFSSYHSKTYAQSGHQSQRSQCHRDARLPNDRSTLHRRVAQTIWPAGSKATLPLVSTPAPPIYPRADVYFFVYEITVGGHTNVIDGTNGTGSSMLAGYRTDNAKIVTIVTTAVHSGNFRLCILFDAGVFTNPSAVQLLRKDGAELDSLSPTCRTVARRVATLPLSEHSPSPSQVATPSLNRIADRVHPYPRQLRPQPHASIDTDLRTAIQRHRFDTRRHPPPRQPRPASSSSRSRMSM